MNKRITFNYAVVLLILDLLLTPLALVVARQARLWLPFSYQLGQQHVYLHPLLYGMVVLIWAIIFPTMSAYDPKRILHVKEQIWTTFLAVSASTLVFAGALYLSFREVPRLLFVYFYVSDLILLFVSRLLLRLLWGMMSEQEQRVSKVLIVGAGDLGQSIAVHAREYHWTGLRLEGYVDDAPGKQGETFEGMPVLGTLDQTLSIIHEKDISEVIFALPLRAYAEFARLVLRLQELPVRVRVVPDVFSLAFFQATIEDFHGVPLIGLRDPMIDGFDRIAKRVFDLVLSILLLLLLWPGLLLVAILVK
ncbi:MAG TPA: hypothetical protein VM537_01710, partial [Anaerolineae bacterium]|nr:hypothetical protein [Anaerolineae bacterium]